MAEKSTAFSIGVCEDVPVVVANTTILTDFVILDIPEDNAMAIILGRPFLNTAWGCYRLQQMQCHFTHQR